MTLAAFIDGNLRGEELRQVEAHLAACRDCALSVEEVREDLTEPLEPIPPEESERFVAFALAAVQREWDARNERNAKAQRERDRARQASRLRRFAAVAACFAALLAISAVGQSLHVLQSDSVARQKSVASVASREGNASLPGGEATSPARPLGSMASTAGGTGNRAAYRAKQPASREPLADADVQKTIDELVAQAEVDAMLPHTDAEYEAWARQEYPHIMWLYDVLTQPQYGMEWNGEPANVPAWAERLYAEVSAADRPRGWRALVVYSGEALNFDYPTEPGQPNVRPRLESVQLAAAVAGFEAKFTQAAEGGNGAAGRTQELPVPVPSWADHGEQAFAMSVELARPPKTGRTVTEVAATAPDVAPVPAGYFAAVSARPDTTQSILRYAAVSDLVVGTPATASLSREAQGLRQHLATISQGATDTATCAMTLPSSALKLPFSARRGLLASLAAQEGETR
jgi:hypothetical protein